MAKGQGASVDKTQCDDWFVTEVLPLEAALMRFLARNTRGGADELEDLRQEIYARLYRSALGRRPEATKALLFATARNLLIDRARRNRVVSIDLMAEVDLVDAVDFRASDRQMAARLEVRRLERAIGQLPARCRAVVMMRKIEDLPQREVARRLGITEDTVERQVSKGVRALAAALFGDNDGDVQSPQGGKRNGRSTRH